MDLAAFRVKYPELNSCSDAIVNLSLSDAANSLSQNVFGLDYDHAQGLLAAHYISISPGGQAARLDPKSVTREGHQQSTYGRQYEIIRNRVTSAIRIL